MKKYYTLLLIVLICNIVYAQNPCDYPIISGKLTYDNPQNTALPGSTVYIENAGGTILDSCISDQLGDYHFCSVIPGNYSLKVKTNIAWGGVNASDALLALKYFAGQTTLSLLRYKAGNVNNNNYINSLDALLITKRFVQMSNSFPIGDWVFEIPEVIIQDSTTQIINIKGICSGDLDGSYETSMLNLWLCGDTLIDQRDQKKYPTIQIGAQCWMQTNLNIGTMVTSINHLIYEISDCADNGIIEKYCINNDPAMCAIYGGLYDWNEMMQYSTTQGTQGICTTGWHIPTDGEWCTLTTGINPTVNCNNFSWSGLDVGSKMKEQGTSHWEESNIGASNESGFAALGAGYRHFYGELAEVKHDTYFWSSTDSDYTYPFYRELAANRVDIGRLNCIKSYGFSVRCVKD